VCPTIGLNLADECLSNTNQYGSYKCPIEPPENASTEEKEIHELLDTLNVFKIEVKRFLEDKQRYESLNVKKAFEEQLSR
jgi:hypothetical protein